LQVFFNALNAVLVFTLARRFANAAAGFVAVLFLYLDSYWWFTNAHLKTEHVQAALDINRALRKLAGLLMRFFA
jgi:hypothetical protein